MLVNCLFKKKDCHFTSAKRLSRLWTHILKKMKSSKF